MSGVDDLAATVNQAQQGGCSLRTAVVSSVQAGPPKSLTLTMGGATLTGIRYSNSYNIAVPAPGDVVMVLVTRPGGSGRRGGRVLGGNAFVIDKIAV